jgi:hypothetical protein
MMQTDTRKPCWTCAAMAEPKFTVETAHIAGMFVGLLLASEMHARGKAPNDYEAAAAIAREQLCAQHRRDLGEACAFARSAWAPS